MDKFRFGFWNILSDAHVIVSLATKVDFLVIDLEHGFRDFSAFVSSFNAAKLSPSEVYVRVRKFDDPWIQALLDVGVENFIVPQIRKLEELNAFIAATKFPPDGKRGIHPRIFQLPRQNSLSDQLDSLPSTIKTCVIIETKEGIEILDEICSNDYVNEIYIGVFDLALEMGIQDGRDSPAMIELCEKIASKVRPHSKQVMVMATSESSIKRFKEMGISSFVVGIDASLLEDSLIERVGIVTTFLDN